MSGALGPTEWTTRPDDWQVVMAEYERRGDLIKKLRLEVERLSAGLPEVECPSCGATIRARMADTPPAPDPTEAMAVLGELVAWWDKGKEPGAVRIAPRAMWDRARALVGQSSGQVRQRD